MYIQPKVETTALIAGGQALCTSPGAGISAGTGGGNTGNISTPGNTDPIPGE